jgi:hypothetical protein
MNVEIHLLIHFLWLRGTFNEQIICQIKETYGDGAIDFRNVQQWSQDLAVRRTELDALPRPGQPMDPENADRIRVFLESGFDTSQKRLSERLNLHQNIVHRILTEELGLCKANFKWIPHSLTESQK